ncbi:sensor histidine kinase [Corynebacterium tuberculostearicum]|uniref:sensor histidine kinase n=2 Tax=Corynebacteriaceae TaxID=1653 RepID=UPI0004018B33|nr:histidine kinase [Corynebacterium tuberculostearicum]NYI56378.1 signal transduction histidine kinase [Corynebacterium tuberculostearicum]
MDSTVSKPSQPPLHQRIRAAMTLQRTAALTAVICVALTLLGAFLTSTEYQLSAAVLGLALTAIATSAYRWPLSMSAAFVITWAIATLLARTPLVSSIFLAPVFLAVVAYHGKHIRTIAIGLVLWLCGLVDPVELTLSLHPAPALTWGMLIGVGGVIGAIFAHSADRYRSAMMEWNDDVKRRQSDLAETLHNSVVSNLTVNTMQLEALSLEYSKQPELVRKLDALSDSMRSSMSEVRALTKVLRNNIDGVNDGMSFGTTTKPTSFAQLISEEEERLQRLNRAPVVEVRGEEFAPEFPQEILDPIAAITTEACLNAVKYSPPGAEITISVRPHVGWTVVTITNPIAKPTSKTTDMSSGIGMSSMTRIAATIDARLETNLESERWELTLSLPPSLHKRR